MKFNYKAFVRWDDLDAIGHVNNAKYLTLVQEARFEWSHNQHLANKNAPGIRDREMVVARAEVDFLKGITTGGIFVDIALWVEKIGNSSFNMVFEIFNAGELCARVRTVQVGVDHTAAKSRSLSDEEREFLKKYLIQES